MRVGHAEFLDGERVGQPPTGLLFEVAEFYDVAFEASASHGELLAVIAPPVAEEFAIGKMSDLLHGSSIHGLVPDVSRAFSRQCEVDSAPIGGPLERASHSERQRELFQGSAAFRGHDSKLEQGGVVGYLFLEYIGNGLAIRRD